MKYLYWLMAILAVMYVLPVLTKSGDSINGSNMKTADKSAMHVTKYLPADDRVIFNTAYGIVKEIKMEEGGEDAFLSSVKGLKPQEVIDLARKEVNARIAKGDGKFAAYKDWDDMIAKLTKLKESPKKRN
ncbi:MAG TPA: hypothetical protein VI457_06880 [Methylococcaceae bacterium]|nr:hypothetical protein [Methylococcaceae bacterium]